MSPTPISTVIEEFPTILFSVNQQGEIRKWNQASEKLTGYTAQEIETGKKNFRDIFSDATFFQALETIKQDGQNRILTLEHVPIVCKDGTEKVLKLVIKYRQDAIVDGLNTWVIGFDVTEQYELSQRLLLSNKRFETISNATNDAIWEWDIEADTLWWGEGINDLFGHPEGGQLTSFAWWSERVHEDDRDRVVNKLRNSSLRGEESWKDEYRFRRKDGTYCIVSDRGWTIFNADKKPLRMIGGMSDITEKKIYEQSLIIKNQQLSEYAFFNSHKVRAPLARLLSCVNLLVVENSVDPATKEILNAIKTSADDLDKEIKEIGQLLSIDTLNPNKI